MQRTWLLLFLLAITLPASATDMYTWTDANGVKHFSDSPPQSSVKAQKLKVQGGVTTSMAAETSQKELAAKTAGPALAAAAGYAPEDIKRNCEVARKNLDMLEAQKIPVDVQGYPVDLDTAKNHQNQMDKANQQIKLFCAN